MGTQHQAEEADEDEGTSTTGVTLNPSPGGGWKRRSPRMKFSEAFLATDSSRVEKHRSNRLLGFLSGVEATSNDVSMVQPLWKDFTQHEKHEGSHGLSNDKQEATEQLSVKKEFKKSGNPASHLRVHLDSGMEKYSQCTKSFTVWSTILTQVRVFQNQASRQVTTVAMFSMWKMVHEAVNLMAHMRQHVGFSRCLGESLSTSLLEQPSATQSTPQVFEGLVSNPEPTWLQCVPRFNPVNGSDERELQGNHSQCQICAATLKRNKHFKGHVQRHNVASTKMSSYSPGNANGIVPNCWVFVPHEHCTMATEQESTAMPKQEYCPVPKEVTRQACADMPTEQCQLLPRSTCLTYPRQKCGFVPCKKWVQLTMEKDLQDLRKECGKVLTLEICHQVFKEQCCLVNMEQRNDMPTEKCQVVTKRSCDTRPREEGTDHVINCIQTIETPAFLVYSFSFQDLKWLMDEKKDRGYSGDAETDAVCRLYNIAVLKMLSRNDEDKKSSGPADCIDIADDNAVFTALDSGLSATINTGPPACLSTYLVGQLNKVAGRPAGAVSVGARNAL